MDGALGFLTMMVAMRLRSAKGRIKWRVLITVWRLGGTREYVVASGVMLSVNNRSRESDVWLGKADVGSVRHRADFDVCAGKADQTIALRANNRRLAFQSSNDTRSLVRSSR